VGAALWHPLQQRQQRQHRRRAVRTNDSGQWRRGTFVASQATNVPTLRSGRVAKAISIAARPADADDVPPALEDFGAVPPLLVYEVVGVGFLRRGWVNLDRVWAFALLSAGPVTPFR
jgi:hypothetical protein